MQTISNQYQYVYLDNVSSHHHTYLISPLLEMLFPANKSCVS